jgi:hypothetical protein
MRPVSQRQDPTRLASLARTQADVVGRGQLAACGYEADAIRRRVGGGRWQRRGLAVVLHGGPLSVLNSSGPRS